MSDISIYVKADEEEVELVSQCAASMAMGLGEDKYSCQIVAAALAGLLMAVFEQSGLGSERSVDYYTEYVRANTVKANKNANS
jgi:hypothetical protein